MHRLRLVLLPCLASLSVWSCTTEVCACSPPPLVALVSGRVFRDGSTPVPAAPVRAYSAPAAGCSSLSADIGITETETAVDGTFQLGLSSGTEQDSVCVFVFARPPVGAADLGSSDTSLVVLDSRTDGTVDSAQVDLQLRSVP
jgi:hypothetical protein